MTFEKKQVFIACILKTKLFFLVSDLGKGILRPQ